MSDLIPYPVSVYRGGTSKGLIFNAKDLPSSPDERDKTILAAYGSPDARQIDGMGGADSLTSKMGIIAKSERPDADIDYTFGQVSLYNAKVDYTGTCGNIASAVGPYAIDKGMIPAVEPVTNVRIYNTNTKKIIVAEIPVEDGYPKSDGTFSIDGVPGTGARITLNFLDSAGSVTGKLLPTGKVRETVDTPFGSFEISFVDSANPVVFVKASELGLTGTELPDALNANPTLLKTLEYIRGTYAVKIGLCDSPELASAKSPAVPKVCFVSPSQTYTDSTGRTVRQEDIDIVGRLMSMQKPHKAYAVSGAICTGTAAKIPGSIVWDMLSEKAKEMSRVRIGHPGGILEVEVDIENTGDSIVLHKAALARTARKLMDGTVYVSSQKVKSLLLEK